MACPGTVLYEFMEWKVKCTLSTTQVCARYCSTAQFCARCYSTAQFCTRCYSTAQFCARYYSTAQICARYYSTAQYCARYYSTSVQWDILWAQKQAEGSVVPSIQPGRPITHKLPSRKLSREFIWFKLTAYAGPDFGVDFGVKRNKSFRNEKLQNKYFIRHWQRCKLEGPF